MDVISVWRSAFLKEFIRLLDALKGFVESSSSHLELPCEEVVAADFSALFAV